MAIFNKDIGSFSWHFLSMFYKIPVTTSKCSLAVRENNPSSIFYGILGSYMLIWENFSKQFANSSLKEAKTTSGIS